MPFGPDNDPVAQVLREAGRAWREDEAASQGPARPRRHVGFERWLWRVSCALAGATAFGLWQGSVLAGVAVFCLVLAVKPREW